MSISRIAHLCLVFGVTGSAVTFSGCAVDYPHPDSVVLQQPQVGKSLIYFLRSPHDSGSLVIEANGKRLAKLQPETYVALSLPPGDYQFLTMPGGLFSNGWGARPLEISLKENERKFFHVSGADEKRIAITGGMSTPGVGFVPLLGRESIVRNREWKECTELDARGLMTISRRVEQD